jgi:hypothetical protein
MKSVNILIPVFLLIHVIIHLYFFAKEVKLTDIEQISVDILKSYGLICLLAAILLIITLILFIAKSNWWFYFALASVFLSTVLIIFLWDDARLGMIPNFIILTLAATSFSASRMNNMIAHETNQILSGETTHDSALITENDLKNLPPPVYNWIKTTGVVGKPRIQTARCKQKALMKMKPGQKRWYAAEALQYSTTCPPAFIWTVSMYMSPIIRITGRDKYVDGKGEMLIRMNSLINIVKERGDKLDEGTVQRYLGELVWLPSLSISPYLTWEAIDHLSAKATLSYKGTSASGVFYFNEHGDFVKFVAMRYMGNKPDSKKYPWVLTVDEYSVFEGIKVPSRMEATWKLDDGDWTWLKLEVVDIKYNH